MSRLARVRDRLRRRVVPAIKTPTAGFVAGFAMAAVGCALVSVSAGLIVGGLALAGGSLLLDLGDES